MVFWKRELRELEASGHRFEDIFRIFSTEFTDTPFSLQFTAGQTQRMSYAELTALTNRLARVLHARFAGQEGAFLAIRMENSPLWVAAFFGTLMAASAAEPAAGRRDAGPGRAAGGGRSDGPAARGLYRSVRGR